MLHSHSEVRLKRKGPDRTKRERGTRKSIIIKGTECVVNEGVYPLVISCIICDPVDVGVESVQKV